MAPPAISVQVPLNPPSVVPLKHRSGFAAAALPELPSKLAEKTSAKTLRNRSARISFSPTSLLARGLTHSVSKRQSSRKVARPQRALKRANGHPTDRGLVLEDHLED